jgi:hypothetical protein
MLVAINVVDADGVLLTRVEVSKDDLDVGGRVGDHVVDAIQHEITLRAGANAEHGIGLDARSRDGVPCSRDYVTDGGSKRICVLPNGHAGPHSDRLVART